MLLTLRFSRGFRSVGLGWRRRTGFRRLPAGSYPAFQDTLCFVPAVQECLDISISLLTPSIIHNRVLKQQVAQSVTFGLLSGVHFAVQRRRDNRERGKNHNPSINSRRALCYFPCAFGLSLVVGGEGIPDRSRNGSTSREQGKNPI